MIRQCAYCGIDYESDDYRRRFCTTKACRRDRRMDAVAAYREKAPRGAGYTDPMGGDPTKITPGHHAKGGGRKKSRGEEL
jgi:hypothetical protein